MLNVYFGKLDGKRYIHNTKVYFENTYDPYWINDPTARKMVKGVDGVDVLDVPDYPNILYDSEYGHSIAPTDLCDGTKTVLLMAKSGTGYWFNGDLIGDNVVPYLMKYAEVCDMNMVLNHVMNFGEDLFSITCTNDGSLMHDMDDVLKKFDLYLR